MRPKIDPTSPFRSSTRRTPFLLRVASASLSLALLGGCTTSSSKGCFPDCGPDAYAIGTAG